MVLVGHSMGGVIARLLTLEGSEDIWMEALEVPEASDRWAALAPLEPYIHFEPFEGVGRAIFLASPHAGTPFAGNGVQQTPAAIVEIRRILHLHLAELRGSEAAEATTHLNRARRRTNSDSVQPAGSVRASQASM